MKHIGVVSHLRLPALTTELKRFALFFDEIQIVGMDVEGIREKYRFIDPQSQAEIEFLYDQKFLSEGVLEFKSIEGLPPDLANQYAVNAEKMRISGEYMKRVHDLSDRMKQILGMMEEWKAQGEDTTPLMALYNQFARFAKEQRDCRNRPGKLL